MAQKVLVLGMLISLHSAGLIFASLFTYKWFVDSNKDVGIFGICEYFNTSSINSLLLSKSQANKNINNTVMLKINYIDNNNVTSEEIIQSPANSSHLVSGNSERIQSGSDLTDQIVDKARKEMRRQVNSIARSLKIFKRSTKSSSIATTTHTTTIKTTTPSTTTPMTFEVYSESTTEPFELFVFSTRGSQEQLNESTSTFINDFNSSNYNNNNNIYRQVSSVQIDDNFNLLAFSKTYQRCFQLIWPDTKEAIQYLSDKPVFLTAMMSVAIASASLGFLTFAWSFVCVIFRSVGSNTRACELLVLLSILADCSTITTFGLFMGKDEKLYSFKYYGMSFWLSVGASCGFFLSSILFIVNRINIGFKYMLRNYQNQLTET